LVYINCETLKKEYIKWADYVMTGSIVGQKQSTKKVLDLVHKISNTIIAGGSLFITGYEEFSDIDTIYLVIQKYCLITVHIF